MKKNVLWSAAIFCLSLVFILPTISHASSINAIADSTISLNGEFNGKNISYLNDGNIPEAGTQWSKQSVWWMGTDSFIQIDLKGQYKISSLSVQADSNDEYQIDYWDAGSDSWKHAWTVANVKNDENGNVPGLVLRESDSALNFVSDKLRISALSGDDHYSISEVQANATPTPLSSSLLLLGTGLGGLAYFRKKFNM